MTIKIFEPIKLKLRVAGNFNPAMYDLSEFRNNSNNKFVRRLDFSDPEAMVSEEEAQKLFDDIIINEI